MDIMIDIETLGTKPGCVVLSVGAVAFNPLEKYDEGFKYSADNIFYQNFTIFDQLIAGLIIEPKTIDWWKDQTSEAQQAIMPDQINLRDGLFRLITWFGNLKGNRGKVWANSPDFDLSILEAATIAVASGIMPWTFRDKADLRTIKHVAQLKLKPGDEIVYPGRIGIHHNALDDCFNQIAIVQTCMEFING